MILKRKLSGADILLIAANLLPVYGVWFLNWHPTEAFIVYALETLIVGIITILKMLVITFVRKKDDWYSNGTTTRQSGFFFILFFILHFGLFALVQTTIFSQTANIAPPGSGLFHFFFNWYQYVNKDIALMLGSFIIGYLSKNFVPFIINGEYKTVPLMLVMFQPYGRIVIQQFTVILGSMFLALGAGKAFILVFALIKIFFDLVIDYNGILKKAVKEMKKDSTKE
ncbi:MAG: DUF6498-containing protein [Chitinophagaceae bacterium]